MFIRVVLPIVGSENCVDTVIVVIAIHLIVATGQAGQVTSGHRVIVAMLLSRVSCHTLPQISRVDSGHVAGLPQLRVWGGGSWRTVNLHPDDITRHNTLINQRLLKIYLYS